MGLAVGDVINTTYTAVQSGQQVRYVLHWAAATAGTSSSPEGDLEAVSQFMTDPAANPLFEAIRLASTADITFTGCMCSRVWPTKTVIMNHAVSIVGGAVIAEMPPNVSVVITKRTLRPGRRGRGSLHMAAVGAPWINNGEVVGDGLTLYGDVVNELISARTIAAVSLTITPGLYNPGVVPDPFKQLFDARLETTSRTMRRRTVRVGI